jgi:UDP-N-acetylglucosamine--N-acetylmuramyl-(pentapeptide) pyrophosphoryl-undecaprenol N-acetylglucosamine transferase
MTTLLVASSGGHLTQMHQLRSRFAGVEADVTWVTFDTPQTRALLDGEDVIFVDHVGSRDYRHVMTNSVQAARILGSREVSSVVSTGAAVALSFLPLARTLGIPCHYIESATRSDGPSRTGKLLSHVPGVSLYTQHEAWADGRWQFAGSVFDGFTSHQKRFPARTLRRAVVTLGAHRGYGFRRLLERLVHLLPPEVEVLWQTGATDTSGLDIEARVAVPADELNAAMNEADVVVSHAGIGSTLCAFEAHRCPLLVPRRAAHGEHVDDHQTEIARKLGDTGLVVARSVEELEHEDLLAAASRKVARVGTPPLFPLVAPEPALAPAAPAVAITG